MKRRDLIKSGLAAAAIAALGGCNNDDKKHIFDETSDITPHQTETYKISTVLPFDFKLIDEIVEMNQKFKKSRVVTLYNNTPRPSTALYNGWLMVLRGDNQAVKGHKDFLKFAKYAQDKGFEICYLMNSPKPFSQDDFKIFKNDFYKLLDELYSSGIKHIKFGNTQIANLINEHNSDFLLSASTALEYHNTSQYKNLVENYPNIKLFDIAIDENHNFPFLRNLKRIFPSTEIELMVNENCIKGCPARISHISELTFCTFDCNKIKERNLLKTIFKMPAIYPWDLEYYSAIGINNFKVTSREYTRANCISTRYLSNFLNAVENGVDEYYFREFCYDMFGFNDVGYNTRVSHLKPYLQDITYFIKNGDKCASRCGATCFRCEQMGEKLEEFIKYTV